MIIRKATKEDLVEIKAITRSVIKNSFHNYLKEETVNRFIISGVCDDYVTFHFNELQVAELENSIVGFCIIKDRTVDLLMVKPNIRNLGEGTNIFNKMYTKLQNEYHISPIELSERIIKPNHFYVSTGSMPRKCLPDN